MIELKIDVPKAPRMPVACPMTTARRSFLTTSLALYMSERIIDIKPGQYTITIERTGP